MNSIDSTRIVKLYRRIGLITCSSVFLLFLFGGLVRATGSGMGCPDWPKCFGLLAPPTCECQLPSNYQEIFQAKRHKKVEKFLKTLRAFGLTERADKIAADKNLYLQEKFDPIKAWIEYINRLFGVLSGLFAVLFLVLSIKYNALKTTRLWSIIGFIMLLLNAWLGSVVVTTNLLPGIVSLHFLLSFFCLFAFVLAVQKVSPIIKLHHEGNRSQWFFLWLIVFVVVILGTWSREQVDMLKGSSMLYLDGNSSGMLNYVGMDWLFIVHRFVPGAILLYSLREYWNSRKLVNQNSADFSNSVKPSTHWLMILVFTVLQICLGAVHIVYVVPAWTQIAHVVLGSALLSYSFMVWLSFRNVNS
jgi:cytochrome c oxidase assembly protein subunit 15